MWGQLLSKVLRVLTFLDRICSIATAAFFACLFALFATVFWVVVALNLLGHRVYFGPALPAALPATALAPLAPDAGSPSFISNSGALDILPAVIDLSTSERTFEERSEDASEVMEQDILNKIGAQTWNGEMPKGGASNYRSR